MKKLLIIIGVTVGLTIRTFAGPIHDAAQNGDIEEIKSLINIGVSVDHKTSGGYTALHTALTASNVDHNNEQKPSLFKVAEYLISIGANVNAEANNGRTPIFIAAGPHPTHNLATKMEFLNLLVNNGANVNHQDKVGKTSLMLTRDSQIASALIENGAEIDVKDILGMTALHNASSYNYAEVIPILLAHKADINAKDKYGMTPLDQYSHYNNRDASLFELLQQAGAKTGLQLLDEKVSQLSTGPTNPTDEWPRKLWEIEIRGVETFQIIKTGNDRNSVLATTHKRGRNTVFWITNSGLFFELPDFASGERFILYMDSKRVVIKDTSSKIASKIIMFQRINDEVVESVFNQEVEFMTTTKGISQNHLGIQRVVNSDKFICWDFTPPTLASTDQEGGNNGGNETANSRITINTAGPDIALATDGALGAAELQKSNDLRSWRKLVDVPEEVSEVLVTPRETGNEFFRLKKKE